MGKDKENFTQEVLEEIDKNEKVTKNKALKKEIQETHDKEFRKHIKDNEYKKEITMFNNNDINKRLLDKENIDIIKRPPLYKFLREGEQMLNEKSIFDRFFKVKFFNNDLDKIYYKNGKVYDFSAKGQLSIDGENHLIHYNNMLRNELLKFIMRLKTNDWKIKKCECESDYNKNICRILKDSNFIIEDKDYYYANEKLKEIFKK